MVQNQSESVPELRFKGFNDAWVQRKFEELLDTREGIRRGPFGSALKKDLFVDSSDYVVYEQQNAIYDQYETRYNITEEKFNELKKFELIPGDYIMSGAGTIGRISEVPNGIKRGVFNQALIRFRINPEVINKDYFLTFMRGDIMQRKLTGANPGSAITNLVPMSEVKKYDIAIPSVEEQAKIGLLLTTLDNLIAANQRKLEALKAKKKAYLERIFNQKLRFSGFTEPWIQRKVGEMAEVNPKTTLPDEFEYVDLGAVIGTSLTGTQHEFKATAPSRAQRLASEGDVFYQTVRPYQKNNYLFENIDSTPFVFSTGYAQLRPQGNSYFLLTLLQDEKFVSQVMDRSTGTSYPAINSSDLGNMLVDIPTEAEQTKIGGLFEKIDNLIAVNQKKIVLLQNQKAAYLQKMFI